MNLFEPIEAAFDLLETAEVLHEFEDSVTLRVSREAWEAYMISAALAA